MPKSWESYSRKALLELAKKKGIPKPYLLSKARLIALLSKSPASASTVKSKETARKGISRRVTALFRMSAKKPGSRVKETKPSGEIHEAVPRGEEGAFPSPLLSRTELSQQTSFSRPPPENFNLPHSYQKTEIVLMVRDPYWIFCYWDLSPEKEREVARLFKERWGSLKSVLRVYDVSNCDFNGFNALYSYDIEICLEARNWYLDVGVPNRDYIVDLGLLEPSGLFHLIARSNRVRTPRDGPSDVIDEEWCAIDFDEMYSLSGGWGIGLSSGELQGVLRRRLLAPWLFSRPASQSALRRSPT